MKKIVEIKPRSIIEDTAVALGNFDGLHIGHIRVIEAAVQSSGLLPTVFTFQEHPHGDAVICSNEDKEAEIEALGVQLMIAMSFATVRQMPAEDFFTEILLGECHAKKICCGGDFRFGAGAKGDVSLLQQLCDGTGVVLVVVPFATLDGVRVSSTEIRKALRAGDVEKANQMLGRPFGFRLKVIHGNHIGTGLGTPTINQALPEGFILPKYGVYASAVELSGRLYYGVTNIGVKPTVGSDRVLSETWIPEFSGDLYGQKVRLSLLGFIRPEQKFNSLEEMRQEIVKNAETAKAMVAGSRWEKQGARWVSKAQ